MKKPAIILFYALFMLCIFVFSCKKKEAEPEQNQSATTTTTTTGGTTTGGTTTGGTTTGGTTTGGTTTGGSTTGANPVFNKVRVTGFRVTEVDDLEPPLGWDPNDGPDVYYIVYKDQNNTIVDIDGFWDIRYNVLEDDLPLMFTFKSPHIINDLDDWFRLSVYDNDGSNDEFIGGLNFRFQGSDYTNYPSSVDKTFYKCKVRIYIEWFN